jgi:catechol 2,3-dioxygenase-like lactoylglutathione lyase family enzyme
MIGQELAYVALAVQDAPAAAAAFERAFALPRGDLKAGPSGAGETVPVLGVGRSALAFFPLGHPLVAGQQRPGLHHIALAAPDPDDAARRAREEGVPSDPDGVGPGLGGGERILLDVDATCGVRTCLSTPLRLPAGEGNGPVRRLDHLGVASADNAAALETFVNRLGLPLESSQTDLETRIAHESFTSDKYGVVHRVREPEVVGGLRVVFVTVGDCELEFLQELDRRGQPRMDPREPGSTARDFGAIARYVATRGAGLHHLAFRVDDIDGELERLGGLGLDVIDPLGRPGSRAARIGFIHPRSLGGILLHLVERTEL